MFNKDFTEDDLKFIAQHPTFGIEIVITLVSIVLSTFFLLAIGPIILISLWYVFIV